MSPESLTAHMASVQIERLRREVAEERRRREMAEAALDRAHTLLHTLLYHEAVAPRTWAEPTSEDPGLVAYATANFRGPIGLCFESLFQDPEPTLP
jgi:hypothetical protein